MSGFCVSSGAANLLGGPLGWVCFPSERGAAICPAPALGGLMCRLRSRRPPAGAVARGRAALILWATGRNGVPTVAWQRPTGAPLDVAGRAPRQAPGRARNAELAGETRVNEIGSRIYLEILDSMFSQSGVSRVAWLTRVYDRCSAIRETGLAGQTYQRFRRTGARSLRDMSYG